MTAERRKYATHSEEDFAASSEQKELRAAEKPAEKKPRVEDLIVLAWQCLLAILQRSTARLA